MALHQLSRSCFSNVAGVDEAAALQVGTTPTSEALTGRAEALLQPSIPQLKSIMPRGNPIL